MEIGFHKFPSGKKYAYWKDNGQPVFLRNIIFLVNEANKHQVAIVREWGAPSNSNVWEPPKGQMEWKEFEDLGVKPNTVLSKAVVAREMRKGVLREMCEEAKVHPRDIHGLKKMPLFHRQPWPESKVPNAEFMYQFWTATINDNTLQEAHKCLQDLVAHPDWKDILPNDLSEKDNIAWYSPGKNDHYIRGGFSKKMIDIYYSH